MNLKRWIRFKPKLQPVCTLPLYLIILRSFASYLLPVILVSEYCDIGRNFLYIKKKIEMCFFKFHQSKNIESTSVTFFFSPLQTEPLELPHRHPEVNRRQPGDFLFCSQTRTRTRTRTRVRRRDRAELKSVGSRHLGAARVFLDSVDDNRTFLLLSFFRWISRKWLPVGYFRVHESGLLWCLLDASWCKMKNKEKKFLLCFVFFFVVNIIYSPVAALASPFRHVTEQRLKVHARCSATQVGFHIPDLHLRWWRHKEKSDTVRTLGARSEAFGHFKHI